jgi:hypothetical protein
VDPFGLAARLSSGPPACVVDPGSSHLDRTDPRAERTSQLLSGVSITPKDQSPPVLLVALALGCLEVGFLFKAQALQRNMCRVTLDTLVVILGSHLKGV